MSPRPVDKVKLRSFSVDKWTLNEAEMVLFRTKVITGEIKTGVKVKDNLSGKTHEINSYGDFEPPLESKERSVYSEMRLAVRNKRREKSDLYLNSDEFQKSCAEIDAALEITRKKWSTRIRNARYQVQNWIYEQLAWFAMLFEPPIADSKLVMTILFRNYNYSKIEQYMVASKKAHEIEKRNGVSQAAVEASCFNIHIEEKLAA